MNKQTWNAFEDAEVEDANLACCHGHEQPNSEIWRQGQKVVPTEPRRCAVRSCATRVVVNAPVLLKVAAGSLWSILRCEDIFQREGTTVTLRHVLVLPESESQSRHTDFNRPIAPISQRQCVNSRRWSVIIYIIQQDKGSVIMS
jgi:hypothetical protein